MSKRTTGDAVRGDEVLGRTLSQTDNGPSPAEPSSGPPNRKVLRTLALVVLLGIAGVVAWAKRATVSSIFHGGNGSDRIVGLSGRIEGETAVRHVNYDSGLRSPFCSIDQRTRSAIKPAKGSMSPSMLAWSSAARYALRSSTRTTVQG